MNHYMNAMRRYVDFSGRSSRSEFWFFILFYIIIVILATVIDATILGSQMGQGIGILSGIVMLVHIIPGLAVSVRRLHDIDRTGFWVLLFVLAPALIWIVGLLIMGGSILMMMGGTDASAAAGFATMGMGFLVIGLIILAIVILAIVFYVTPGTLGPNTYGPPPA